MNKRLSVLKESAESSRSGRWSHFRTAFLCLLSVSLFTYFILPEKSQTTSDSSNAKATWNQGISRTFEERLTWLENSPLVLMPGAAQLYFNFGQAIDGSFQTQVPKDETGVSEVSFGFTSFKVSVGRFIIGAALRLSFVFIAFWPIWLICFALGFFAFKRLFIAVKSETLLGVCERGDGPFYSGIHGPLKPNGSFSGTDFSCPGLACPSMAKKNTALGNKLTLLLKEYDAFNETNFDLVRVIIDHADFPSLITDETAWEDETESLGTTETTAPKKSETSFFDNQGGSGSLMESSLLGLSGVLDARKKIGMYIQSIESKGITREALDKNYNAHLSNLSKLTQGASSITKLLIYSLTPTRLWALGKTPPEMIAAAYLATEAGKCLVYKIHESGYTKISNFPHLQARAVLHSLTNYHKDFNGDQRLSIRQAIICSRRHGDFGRAFLPINMPIATRAIRDWLEILYSEPTKQSDAAHLVELDGHLDEIHLNWRANLNIRMREDEPAAAPDNEAYKRGISHKSVVLMPVLETLFLALKGIHELRLKRIVALLESTAKFQNILSISARLPGFKRQVLEADDSLTEEHLQRISKDLDIQEVFSRWRVVRRMLARYNWLSTRIGDDSVPVSGLVQTRINAVNSEGNNIKIGLEAVTPLRTRRFAEMFGRKWEETYYPDSRSTEQLEIFTSLAGYNAKGGSSLKPSNSKDTAEDEKSTTKEGAKSATI